jgi:hypothetical protein
VKTAVKVHSVWRDVLVAAMTGGLLCIILCACARTTVKEKGIYSVMHIFCHGNFFLPNKQNHNVQTCEQGRFAVFRELKNKYDISRSHSCKYEDDDLLGYCAM